MTNFSGTEYLKIRQTINDFFGKANVDDFNTNFVTVTCNVQGGKHLNVTKKRNTYTVKFNKVTMNGTSLHELFSSITQKKKTGRQIHNG